MFERFPNPIRTERMILRPPVPEDAPALNRAIHESFSELSEWMPWAKTLPTLDETREKIAGMIQRREADEDLVIFGFEAETGEFIVASGLHLLDRTLPSVHIGYWCRLPFHGLGYVTEAVKAIRDAAFAPKGIEARRVEIRCDAVNKRSIAVAERCGFRLEGTFENDDRNTRGRLTSTMYFAQTRDDEYYED